MRVVYWNNSCLEPGIEAVSKEIFQLAGHFSNSHIFGVSPHYLFRSSLKGRYHGFHTSFDPALRVLIPLIEAWADINHVYGEPCPWIYFKTLKRRPIILTIASEKGEGNLEFYDRCRTIIVQTESYKQKLLGLGISQHKIEVLYPGIDVAKGSVQKTDKSTLPKPTIAFATAPRSQEEMAGRGVYLLLEAARVTTEVDFRLLYRPWRTGYTSLSPTENFIEQNNLTNVHLTNSAVPNMFEVYGQCHFTVIPYTTREGGKECPNSMVEGFACGVPVLISSVSPFSHFVEQHECGVVFEPTPSKLIEAVEYGMRNYERMSRNAINVSFEHFSQERVFQVMSKIYGRAA